MLTHTPHTHLTLMCALSHACTLTFTHTLRQFHNSQSHSLRLTHTCNVISSLQLCHTFTHSHTLTCTSTCAHWTTGYHVHWRGQLTRTLAGWSTSLTLAPSVPRSLTGTRLHPTLSHTHSPQTLTLTLIPLTPSHMHTHAGSSGPSPGSFHGGPTCPLGLAAAVPRPQQQHPEKADGGVPSQAGHSSPTPGNTHFSAGKRQR